MPNSSRRHHAWQRKIAIALAVSLWPVAALHAEAGVADPARGRLLYETHCGACHAANMHWREQRLVRSWSDLVAQVTRWQGNIGQRWNESDIVDVANYLNQSFYHLPCTSSGCAGGRAGLGGAWVSMEP